jgi:response regulator RpfG family c-di-GMP phosphodiesterase
VECESSPGRTKFIVTLPYTFRESASLEGKHSVAIIDDNVYILQAWQKAMSGAEVKVFRDSATAGQYAKEYGWPFSITIVDLHLQDGTTGIDLATELREGSKSLFFLSTDENVESCPGWMTLIGKDPQSIDDLLQLQQAA